MFIDIFFASDTTQNEKKLLQSCPKLLLCFNPPPIKFDLISLQSLGKIIFKEVTDK